MRLWRLLLVSLVVLAQEPSQEPSAAPAQERPVPRAAEPEIRPYEKVITKDAVTQRGVFTVHRIKSRLYYEIPPAALGEEFLWVTKVARTPGLGYGGMSVANRVVRWERKDNRVLLRNVSYEVVADDSHPISRAVRSVSNETIIMSFPIEALAADGSPVVDVTRLFTSEVAEFTPRAMLRARGFDVSRSFLERVKAYPLNIEVEASHTYTSPVEAPPVGQAPTPPSPPSPMSTAMRPGSATLLMHFSMVKLPEQPMRPRLYDERVGYFNIRQYDYSRDEQRAPRRTYIIRWRLEKKNPSAAVSEPVKPIVFYVDPATPPKWVPYIKRGVEWWKPVFEQAGFRNAIMAMDPPSPEQDPDWAPEDARYSVIRWAPSTVENAMGPNVHDPRTGEIIEADIVIWHNVLNLVRHWYFTQVGPLDPRARRLPLPDDLMGKLLEYVVAHEVGHTLGLPHNMKASSLYPLEKVRDREWVKKMSHTPSIMDYSRFNYVAQPEDNIDPDDLIPKIGPYDYFSIMWGYKPIPEARTPDEEKPVLEEWILAAQEKTPWLRFSTAKAAGSDPGENTEAVGDADPVRATELGLRNLRRVMDMLMEAVPEKGKPYDDLEEVYGRVLGQWVREMNHVTGLVGGFYSQQKHAGQQGVLFTPVERERQATAVKFLNENAFRTPTLFIRPEILRRIEPQGVLDRIRNAQRLVLNSLLDGRRFARLVEQEALDGPRAYRPAEFLADLRRGIFAELASTEVRVDAVRRNLQRLYLEMLSDRLNGRTPVTDDQRPFSRAELRSIAAEAARALPRAADRATRAHLEDLRDQANRALDPKFLLPSPAAPSPTQPQRPSAEPEPDSGSTCWPDLVIRP
ncbi:MAG: zinc-dependent metalloprotease [Bryobacteraceae bacterium]